MSVLQPDISSCELGYHLPHANLKHHLLACHDIQLQDDQLDRRENIYPAAREV
jgi:hypothetical protein